MGSNVGGVGFGGMSLILLLCAFIVLWIFLGRQNRKQENNLHKLKMDRKAQLQKLKAEKRAEQAAQSDSPPENQ